MCVCVCVCVALLYELLYERVFREERSVLVSAQRGGRSSELTDDHMTACPSSDESETEDPIWWDPVGRLYGVCVCPSVSVCQCVHFFHIVWLCVYNMQD